MDDRKRAEYNYRWQAGADSKSAGAASNKYSQSQYSYGRNGSGYGDKTRYDGLNGADGGFEDEFGTVIRILTARSPFPNLGFVA